MVRQKRFGLLCNIEGSVMEKKLRLVMVESEL